MALPEDVQGRVASALENATSWRDVERSLRAVVPGGEEERHQAFAFAFGYLLVAEGNEERRERVGGPLGAMMSGDGWSFPPPLSELPEEILEEWAEFVQTTNDPVAISRLHDLLWERRAGTRPDLHARGAVDAYLLVAEKDTWRGMERAECIVRALELARSVKDHARTLKAVEKNVAGIRADLATEDDTPGLSLTLASPLVRLPVALRPEGLDALLIDIDARYGRDPHIGQSALDLRAALAADPAERRGLRQEQVRRWREAPGEEEKGELLRMMRLQRALELARTHHLVQEANDLRRELQEIEPEALNLSTFSEQVELPAAGVDAYLQTFVAEEGWQASLIRFGDHGPPGGADEELRQHVAEEKEDFPLQHLMTQEVIGPGGAAPIFRAADDLSHERLALAQRRALHAHMWSLFAVDILAAIHARHGLPTRQDLTEFFTTTVIAAEVAERIGRAVELYWQGEPDESAHVLVP